MTKRLSDFLKALSMGLAEMDRTLRYGCRGIIRHLKELGRILPSNQQDEIGLIDRLCALLRENGMSAYPNASIVPDIDVRYPGTDKIKIEAKTYWTFYFNDRDTDYCNPRPAGGSQTWQRRIRTLVSDCRDKLVPQCAAPNTSCGGLLIGFELRPNTGTTLIGNPSHEAIVSFMRSEVERSLPAATIRPLSPEGGWSKEIDACPRFTFLTFAWYWEIASESLGGNQE